MQIVRKELQFIINVPGCHWKAHDKHHLGHGVDVVEYALEAELSLHFIRLLQDLVARVHKSNSKKKAHRNLMNTHSQLHQNDSSEWVTML
jgi:hypothetical protein